MIVYFFLLMFETCWFWILTVICLNNFWLFKLLHNLPLSKFEKYCKMLKYFLFKDMSTENCTIKYTVDGKDQGIAFRFQKKELKVIWKQHVLFLCFYMHMILSDNLYVLCDLSKSLKQNYWLETFTLSRIQHCFFFTNVSLFIIKKYLEYC